MRQLLSFSVILIGLLLGTIMVSGARTSWTIHRENGMLQRMPLPAFPPPRATQRLLILSPHPDDETLGCGGLIRRAREQAIPVTVAIVTNGDAYPLAVRRAYRTIEPRPRDYIRFGELRQAEARRAVRRLGVPDPDILFLGYPDQGMARLWMSHWDADRPFTAPGTRCTSNPYPATYHPGAPYTGEALTADLAAVIRAARPTDIFFTHPNDEHPDHAYLSCFVLAALEALGGEGRGIRLHAYLVHRGDWPVPQGYRPQDRLPPPEALIQLDTRWSALRLSPAEIQAKTAALRAYSSQLHIPPGGRFLYSFIRRNELFGDYRAVLSAAHRTPGPRYATPWLYSLDPLEDKLTRDFQPAADLEGIGVCRSGGNLKIRLVTRGRLSRWVRYRLSIHRLDAREPEKPAEISLIAGQPARDGTSVTRYESSDDELSATIPLSALGDPTRVMVGAETLVGGMVVDRAAWRGFSLE